MTASETPTQRHDSKTLGVAMIGYAFMGKAHSNAWRNVASYFDVPAFEQKVLVGRDAAGVAEAAAKYGWAETATDWRSVLDREDIDIVDICAPGWMHAEIAIAALQAGKHVLVEKPLANTLAEAEAMAAAAAGSPGQRRPIHDRLQLPARARAGPGPGTHHGRPGGNGPPGPRLLPPGLAGG